MQTTATFTVRLRARPDVVVRRLVSAAERGAAGPVQVQWAPGTGHTLTLKTGLRAEAEQEGIGQLLQRLQDAAEPEFVSVGVELRRELPNISPDDIAGSTEVVRAPPAPDAARTELLGANAAGSTLWTATNRPRIRRNAARDKAPAEPIELVVRAVLPKNIEAMIRATGQELSIQLDGPWNVVDGEVIRFRPTKLWKFARHALAGGELLDVRLDPSVYAVAPLALVRRGAGAWEIEEVELESEQQGDDPVGDARAALKANKLPAARELARAALLEDLRSLEAHQILAEAALREGTATHAARHDVVLLTIAEQALPAGFSGVFPPSHAGNTPLHRAFVRLLRAPPEVRAPAAGLLQRWTGRLSS